MRPIIDAHLDLAWSALQWGRDLTQPLETVRQCESHMTDHRGRGRGTVTLPEMRAGRIAVCLGTVLARTKPNVCPAAGFNRRDLDFRTQAMAYAMGQGQLAYYRALEQQGHLRFIRTADDLQQHWQAWTNSPDIEPLGLIVAMEGADPIVTPAQAQEWFSAGLRCVGMAHYGQGIYAHGTGGEGPLTQAGHELLRQFERLGMIVDLTHCAEPGFFEVLDRFSGPVHASHNMCRALVPADRQFSDEQIRALLQRDAVIGMAFDAWMLYPAWKVGQTSNEVVSLANVADHVDYICQLAGNARHVGIGSDLDGGFGVEQTPHDLGSIAGIQKLDGILKSRGYSDADVDGIFHGNWLRFFTMSLPTAS
ncbi:MAG TPA: membrane dipeptidase [Tepidisphaeraceae bacterium]|nr:membrane dipeptidase [Tepidisphaeraceae bacterium]